MSYCHIRDICSFREDEYFKRITDVKIKQNPNYLHQIFVASTEIPNLCVLIRYDPKWFDRMVFPKLNLDMDKERSLNNYMLECEQIGFDDDDEEWNDLKADSLIISDVIKEEILVMAVQKIFVIDQSTHALVRHLKDIGLRQLEMYHKPFLLGIQTDE